VSTEPIKLKVKANDFMHVNLTYSMVKNLNEVIARMNYYSEMWNTLSLDSVKPPEEGC
jgi:hypothetical protein